MKHEVLEETSKKICDFQSSILNSSAVNDNSLYINTKILLEFLFETFSINQSTIDKDKFILDKVRKEILTEKDIPKPLDFDYIHDKIKPFIKIISKKCIIYSVVLYGKKISIFFVYGKEEYEDEINIYINRMILLLLTLIPLSEKQKECSKELSIYIYFTEIKKNLPDNEEERIDKFHINTGFTESCKENNSIVIYRKEEWFKVFIHETIHNFNLDFASCYESIETDKRIKTIFNIPNKCKIKLFEAYTDFWAKIINVCICIFCNSESKEKFIENSLMYINIEKLHIIFQAVKVLRKKGLVFHNMYCKSKLSLEMSKKYYQNTSEFSYYIINSILFNNFDEFIEWCMINNKYSVLQFNNNLNECEISQKMFIDFIEISYNKESFSKYIRLMEEKLDEVNDKVLEKTMRKSALQLLPIKLRIDNGAKRKSNKRKSNKRKSKKRKSKRRKSKRTTIIKKRKSKKK